MSPSITQVIPDHFRTSNIAVRADLPGLNPWDESFKIGSYTASNMVLKACWIILSLGLGIPRGLIFPLGLGMRILLTGLNLKLRSLREFIVFPIHYLEIPSKVSLFVPGVMFPGLDLMASYDCCRNSGLQSCLYEISMGSLGSALVGIFSMILFLFFIFSFSTCFVSRFNVIGRVKTVPLHWLPSYYEDSVPTSLHWHKGSSPLLGIASLRESRILCITTIWPG